MQLNNIAFFVFKNSILVSMDILFIILIQNTVFKRNHILTKALWIICILHALCPISLFNIHIQRDNMAHIGERTEVQASVGGFNPVFLLVLVWAGGAVLLCMRMMVRYLRCSGLWPVVRYDGDDIYVCSAEKMAVVYGIFRQQILVSDDLPDDVREYVLAHERQHMKSRDNLLKFLYTLIKYIYWFNPIIWIGTKYLNEIIELVCDDHTTAEYDSMQRYQYVKSMLYLSGYGTGTLSVNSGFAVVKSELVKRAESCLQEKDSTMISQMLKTLLLGCICGFIFMGIHVDVDEPMEEYSMESKSGILMIEDAGADPKSSIISTNSVNDMTADHTVNIFLDSWSTDNYMYNADGRCVFFNSNETLK